MSSTRRCPNCGQEVDAAEAACAACGRLSAPRPCARHPQRLAYGECVICDVAVCKECDATVSTHYLCPSHRDVEVIQGWAQVYKTAGDVEAGLIRENLHAEGIDARILSQKDRMLTFELGELAQVRVLVPAYDYERATSMLAHHMDERGEVSFACPHCGEAYGADDVVCSACGKPLKY